MSVIQRSERNQSASPPPSLSIYLLGVPRVRQGGRSLDVVKSPKLLVTLAYLVTEPGPHPRDLLAAHLWPDGTAQQTQRNLRQILYRLRKLLDDGNEDRSYLVTDRQTVYFDAHCDVWTDVAAFETLMEQARQHPHRRLSVCRACIARLEEATRLYRGPFLKGLGDVDSVAIEQWLLLWRESLQQQAFEATYTLAEYHLAHGQAERAREHARYLLGVDPWNETVERLLLEATWQLEGRNAALREYHRFAADLSSELDVVPEDDTQILVERIEASDSEGPTPIGDLPEPITPFFGREEEQAQLTTYLAQREQRLITLVGVGGSGKTRLALQVARAQRPDWRDGVWFVPLVKATTTEWMAEAILEVLTPTSQDTRPASSRLFDYLRDRELLLILDNLEHLVPKSTALLRNLLRYAPQVNVLITSQARLDIPEEWVIPLTGLELPPHRQGAPKADVADYSAIQLFLHHARRVNPAWSPGPEDWSDILRICEHVAGLPLGVELAAAWARNLSCRQIAAASGGMLDFFQSGASDETARHHSLRRTFTRAYAMLSPEEQRLFRRLSVFQGGFEFPAAEQVCDASITKLAVLLDRSLLQVSGTGRLSWHPLLQRYAVEMLVSHPLEAQTVRQHHADYYLTLLESCEELWWGEHNEQAMSEVDREIENVEAAWNWAVSQQDVQTLALSLDKLSLYYYLKGLFRRGEDVCATATRRLLSPSVEDEVAEGPSAALVARLMAQEARFLARQARYEEAVERGQEAAMLSRPTRDRYAEARACLAWGRALHQQGTRRQAARAPLQRALTLTQLLLDTQDPNHLDRTVFRLRAESHRALAALLWKESEYPEARAHLRQADQIDRQIGDMLGAGWTNNSWGLVLESMDHHDMAIAHYREALRLFRKAHDRRGESFALGNLGYIHSRLGRYEQAHEYYRRDLRICREMGDRRGRAWTLDNLSLLACREGRHAAARQYAQQALTITQEIKNSTREAHVWTQMGRALMGLGRLIEAIDAYDRAVTLQRELGSRPLELEAQAGLARVALARGDPVRALAYAEGILSYLETHELARTDDQLGIYLSVYRTLQANDDRRAKALLTRAIELLNHRAAQIEDEALRQSFYERVDSHSRLLREWQRLQASSSSVRLEGPTAS
jgi:predicted ATPase/DNA-binding SARP family transcriptional activator